MNPRCQEYRSVIPDLFSGFLTPQRSGKVRRHIDDCAECRGYFESLQRDDGLFSRFAEAMQPSVAAVEDSVIGSLASCPDKSATTPMPSRLSLKANWVRLAVAAAIGLAVLGAISRLLGPSVLSSPTLAQTLETMRSKPWVHSITHEQSSKGILPREDWEQFNSRVRASRMPDRAIHYVNFAKNVAYSYDPDSNRITVSFANDRQWPQYKTPVERLSEIVQLAQQGGARIHVERGTVEDRHAERIRLDFTGNADLESVAITRETGRNVVIRMERNALRGTEEHRTTIAFDYPDSGPADIYALGVPADAAVRDLRSKAPTPVRVEQPPAGSAPVSDGNAVAPSKPEQEEPPVATAPEEPPAQGITGVVKDEQGRAIADATVILFHKHRRWGLDDEIVQRTMTDPNGHCLLTTPINFKQLEPHDYAQDSYILFATHPDYALAWQNIRQGQVKPAYELILTRPTTRAIVVTDKAGNPIPGARVWLYEAGDRTSSNPLFQDDFLLETDIGLVGGTTDANGSVIFTNLPATGCCFNASLKGFATGLAFSGRGHIRLTAGADVSGWVLTAAGRPVAGAIVRLQADWMHSHFLARSDKLGRFEFADLPAEGWDMSPWGKSEGASGAYTMVLEHADYAAPDRKLELLPGQMIDDLVIEVAAETTLVRCLVVEEGTDKPVPGARVSGENKIGAINGYSDAKGVFTVRVIPGPTSLSFYSPPNGVYILEDSRSGGSRVQFDAQGAEMTVTVTSPPIAGQLVSVPGVVLGPQRMPVAGAAVYASAGRFETATAGSYVRPTGADAEGRFEMKEVPAGRDLHLLAETKDHSLAAVDVVHIPEDVNELPAIELILQPTQTCAAVILDKDGNPATDTALSIAPMVEGERMWMSSAARNGITDQLGILQMHGIIPGLTYRLRDARFDDVTGRLPDGYDKWLDCEMVLIPVK